MHTDNITSTIGRDGRIYYFRNGKRISHHNEVKNFKMGDVILYRDNVRKITIRAEVIYIADGKIYIRALDDIGYYRKNYVYLEE